MKKLFIRLMILTGLCMGTILGGAIIALVLPDIVNPNALGAVIEKMEAYDILFLLTRFSIVLAICFVVLPNYARKELLKTAGPEETIPRERVDQLCGPLRDKFLMLYMAFEIFKHFLG